jgi:ubiquinone biosynthesis protein
MHRALTIASEPNQSDQRLLQALIVEQQRTNRLLSVVIYAVAAFVVGSVALEMLWRWSYL